MMALTITLQTGSKVLIGETEVEVIKIYSSSDLVVRCKGEDFDVDEEGWTKVQDGIELRAPYPRADRTSGARLQIEAPGMYVKRL